MTYDPWDQADSAEPRPFAYYGQIFTSAEAVAFEPTGEMKPDGKPKMALVGFDPQVHKDADRRVQVGLELVPLAEMHLQFTMIQKTMDTDNRWVRFTLPSLKALNLTGRSANNQWVRLERRPTGKKFTTRTGETKDETAMFVTAVFPSEAACLAAWSAEFVKEGNTVANAEATPVQLAGDPQKTAAAKFLPALWNQAGKDLARFAELLAKTNLVSQYFTIDSPEVLAVVGGAA
jgi:hypothetical protein